MDRTSCAVLKSKSSYVTCWRSHLIIHKTVVRQHREGICQSPRCLQPWSLWTDTSRINHFHHTSGTSWIRFMFPDFVSYVHQKQDVGRIQCINTTLLQMSVIGCSKSAAEPAFATKKVLTQRRIWVRPWICSFLELNFLNIFKCIYSYIYFYFF